LAENFTTAQNPSLAFDSRGKLSIVYTLSFQNQATNAVVISESTDLRNFVGPSVVSFRQQLDGIIDSRPVIAIAPSGDRYVAWDSFSFATLRYSINLRSEANGVFGPTITVLENGLVSSPALALSKSDVYIGWDDWGFNSTSIDNGGRLMVTSSPLGAKLDFDAPYEIARTSIGFRKIIPAMPDKGAGPNLRLAVDPQKDDIVYSVFADEGNGMDIRFGRSVNRGKAWKLTTVNDDATMADQFSPAIAVAADSNVNVSFYDTRLSTTFEAAHVYLARPLEVDRDQPGNIEFVNARISTALADDSKTNLQRDRSANLADCTAIAIKGSDVVVSWTGTGPNQGETVYLSVIELK
jgi:hypothetical protein